uniref:UPAR/Ly6 domain-containing protein n=1 Tax=Panagrolaimus sp. PS1159 TaxID=55785 RepID=A0AC35GFB8_9BILA
MKAFILVFIFCFIVLSQSLTCFDSLKNGTTECSPSVNFCVTRKIVRHLHIQAYLPIGIESFCNESNDCEKNGHFSKPTPGFLTKKDEYYCCDTDLCNSEENFKGSDVKPNSETNIASVERNTTVGN